MANIDFLDNLDFKKTDPEGMISHIEAFPELIRDAFTVAKSHTLPSYYIKAKKVVLLGMGGSGAAGDIIRDLLVESGLVVESIHNYILPGFVDKETLVIASSYSGNTEETLAGFISGFEKGAKLVAITTGGRLKILAEKYNAPVFNFNYQAPPRATFPYLFVLLYSIFVKLGYLHISETETEQTLQFLENTLAKYRYSNSLFSNPAKILAQKILGKSPIIYATEKLAGVAKRFKDQINENAKNFAFYELLPEANHNAIEAYGRPKDQLAVIILESNFDQTRNILRENILAEIIHKNHLLLERVKFIQAKDQLVEILVQVMFGDFVSFYLAMLNRVNPSLNDTVDILKKRMG